MKRKSNVLRWDLVLICETCKTRHTRTVPKPKPVAGSTYGLACPVDDCPGTTHRIESVHYNKPASYVDALEELRRNRR